MRVQENLSSVRGRGSIFSPHPRMETCGEKRSERSLGMSGSFGALKKDRGDKAHRSEKPLS
ncbi:MAG: hypothetical protein AMJ94_07575 [Deltaproteobacteria bacterium SM23_61]|nr:MAG: hypothetical protein AMJ94_07575 [Deltaproteobacteria bacterium SM23_61]